MDDIRTYLVTQLQSSGSVEQFDLAEALLVMYDSGIVTATKGENGEPQFLYNHEATNEQKDEAQLVHETICDADNDVWNDYINNGGKEE